MNFTGDYQVLKEPLIPKDCLQESAGVNIENFSPTQGAGGCAHPVA